MSTRAEISCGAIFLPCTSTHASPLSALTMWYGTMPTSFCTTASSYLRPIRRLIACRVFCGFVTAWRLADCPTSTSSSFVKATIDGVVRSPSLFSITRGLPPSMIATQELVVPRSMPMTFAMEQAPWNQEFDGRLVGGRLGRIQGHEHAGRSQQSAVQQVALLDHRDDRAVGMVG